MPTVRLTVSGPPGTVNTNLASIVAAITASGATLADETRAEGDANVTSDPAVLAGTTVAFRGRVVFFLNATRTIVDSLTAALGPIKTGAPALRFNLTYDEPVSL
jgi:hypothetical protein